jgi:DNA polymerase III delta prime subunit
VTWWGLGIHVEQKSKYLKKKNKQTGTMKKLSFVDSSSDTKPFIQSTISAHEPKCWAEKNKPKTLNDLTWNPELTNFLKQICRYYTTAPPLLLYGPSGAGKVTRVRAILREICGHDTIFRLKHVKVKDKEYPIWEGSFSIELSPQLYGSQDHVVIQEVLTKVSRHIKINMKTMKTISPSPSEIRKQIIVIYGLDYVSKLAKDMWKHFIETYSHSTWFIAVSERMGCIGATIKSMMLMIRVPRPRLFDLGDNSEFEKIFVARESNMYTSTLFHQMLKEDKTNQKPFRSIWEWEQMCGTIAKSLMDVSPITSWWTTLSSVLKKYKIDPKTILIHITRYLLRYISNYRYQSTVTSKLSNNQLAYKIMTIVSQQEHEYHLHFSKQLPLQRTLLHIHAFIKQN